MLTTACCFSNRVSVRVRIRFACSVWLVGGYAPVEPVYRLVLYYTSRCHCHSPRSFVPQVGIDHEGIDECILVSRIFNTILKRVDVSTSADRILAPSIS